MALQPHFSSEAFDFLRRLKRNNRREWFLKNKAHYERVIKEPSIRFVYDAAETIHSVSPYLLCDPKSSLFRIYRDIRFSNDKRPYKTNVGIQFSHGGGGKDVHAPGYYLQLAPEECFICGGIWRPDRIALLKIREAIVSRPDAWTKVKRGLTLSDEDKLTRPPRGFPAEHPHLDDLKRKSVIALIDLSEAQICSPRFTSEFEKSVRKMAPLVEFLSRAMEMKW
jgi:uncharacterized protein (TIGR02453 family)